MIPAVEYRHPELGHVVDRPEVRGSHTAGRLPDRLGQIEFACATDCSFDSSYF